MTEQLQESQQTQEEQYLQEAQDFFGQSMGRIKVQACERKEKRASIRTIESTPFGPPLTRIRPFSGKSVRKVQAFGPNGAEISGGQLAGWVLRTGVGVVQCGSYSATRWASNRFASGAMSSCVLQRKSASSSS
jgi:hypothetical protein